MLFRQLFDHESWTYTYILADARSLEAVIIDPVLEQSARDLEILEDLGLTLKYVLETHLHADHVTGAALLREATGAKVAISQASGVQCADLLLGDGDRLAFGTHELLAIATPGHTNSCMSYLCEGRVFTGDVLFIRDVGRTDFQQGSPEKMYRSITEKLFALPEATLVYPAHDYKGRMVSTIAEEKARNTKVGSGKSYAQFQQLVAEMKLGQPKKIHIAVPANMQCGKMQLEAGA